MRTIAVLFCLGVSSLVSSSHAVAGIILETATGDRLPFGNGGGYIVSPIQYIGARFHLGVETDIDHIGGTFFSQNNGQSNTIFGAIVGLSGPSAFPTTDLPNLSALAHTTFTLPPFGWDVSDNVDVLVPLAITLAPGDYAVVFGSGQFGATGHAGTTAVTMPDPTASFISTLGSGFPWHDTDLAFPGTRFIVTGTASEVPEPASCSLFGLGVLGLAANRQRRRTKKSS